MSANFCVYCGAPRAESDRFCMQCGAAFETPVTEPTTTAAQPPAASGEIPPQYTAPAAPTPPPSSWQAPPPVSAPARKSKIAAGLLALFLGSLGVHNFYLGYNGRAVAQLLMTLVGWILVFPVVAAAIWAFIEGILLLCGSITVDGNGHPLGD